MNMLFSKKLLLATVICLSVISCNQSDNEQAAQNSTSTTTAETPLIIPDATQTSSTNLQDIWVLDSINSIAPDSNYFAHGTPVLDLNLEKKTLTGHTGCNGVKGKIKVDGEKIIFDSLKLASNEVCRDKGFEKKLLSSFRSGNTTYKILNDKLHLNVGEGSNFIFRRIRRG